MKKILSVLLSICILMTAISVLPFTAFAQETDIAASSEQEGDFEYMIMNGGAYLCGYTGSAADLVIPSSLGGYPVISIIMSAFSGCDNLVSVTLPDTLKSLTNGAFFECPKLRSVKIPASVENIFCAFRRCPSLKNIQVDENNPVYDSRNNCNAAIRTADNTLVQGCVGTVIPDTVEAIGTAAFSECTALTGITIPDSVTVIETNAFANCSSLESIDIPAAVKTIGDHAFYECVSLASVSVPDTVEEIGEGAFHNTVWENNQPQGLVYLGKTAYLYKGECPSEVIFRNGVTSISGSAFKEQTSLLNITFPDTLKKIGRMAFTGCEGLTSVSFPSSVAEIQLNAFSECSNLSQINFPDLIPDIDTTAFDDTAWFNNQPDGVVYAGKLAYMIKGDCPADVEIKPGTLKLNSYLFYFNNIRTVSIPDSVTIIGNGAFAGCRNLTSVNIPQSVSRIESSTFNGCRSLKSISIPDSIKWIGTFAFMGCTSLQGVEIPDSVTEMGYSVFNECTGLKKVKISNTLQTIPWYTFDGCKALSDVTIPNSVTDIQYDSFRSCDSLSGMTVPYTVKSIGEIALGYTEIREEVTDAFGEVLYWTHIDDKKRDDFSITGYKNTEAQRYADDNGFPFIELGEVVPSEPSTEREEPTVQPPEPSTDAPVVPTEPDVTIGDVDGDGVISVLDATRIQKFKAKLCNIDGAKYNGTEPTDAQKQIADVDKDGVISVLDATRIQKYKAKLCNLDGSTPYTG